jgi:hypothetical protein
LPKLILFVGVYLESVSPRASLSEYSISKQIVFTMEVEAFQTKRISRIKITRQITHLNKGWLSRNRKGLRNATK